MKREVFERMIGDRIKDLKPGRDHLGLYDFWPAGIREDADYPWPSGDHGGQLYLTEDYAFSLKARQLGYRIFADTGVMVEHIGPG